MKSLGMPGFWKAYHALPDGIKEATRAAYKKFLQNPAHPSLQLERLRSDPRFWSVRVTREYRAVAQRLEGDQGRILTLPPARGLQAASGSERAQTKCLACGRPNDEAA